MNPQHGGRKGEEGARGSGAHLVLVAIVGLEESFSKSVQLPEAGDHPHSLEVKGHTTVLAKPLRAYSKPCECPPHIC